MKALVTKLRSGKGAANIASVIGTAALIGAFVFYPQVFYGFAGYVWRTTLSQMASIRHNDNVRHLPNVRHVRIVHHQAKVAKPKPKHVRVKRAGH